MKPKHIESALLAAALAAGLCGCEQQDAAKPVIYLYPEEETAVHVTLDYDGTLTAAWPAYEGGWDVTARPDGTLTAADGSEYTYLFWEGVSDTTYDFSEGFCVAGEDTGGVPARYAGGDRPDAQRVQRVYRVLAAPNAG